MINDINTIVARETQKAIRAILESRLSSEDERQRQEDQKDSVKKRNLQASDDDKNAEESVSEDEEKDENQEDKKAKKEKESGKREDRTKGRGTADSPKLKDPDIKTLKNPPVNAVIDKLNALRGGKSLKDPDVRKSFSQYYNSLSNEEQQSLLLFLTGIAQILSEVEPGAEAVDPSDAGLRVKSTGEDKDPTDKPEGADDSKTKAGTTENPIIVGEVASKYKIMKALREYSKYSK